MGNLEQYISNLEKEFESNSFDAMKTASKEEKLLYLFSYYHYFNADNSKISDVIQGDVFDKQSLDKIAGIYIDSDSDSSDVDAIVVKYLDEDDVFDFPLVLRSFKDAETMLLKAISNSPCRKEIQQILSDEDYKISSHKPLKIKIITNYNPPNVGKKRTIINALNALKPSQDYISFSISFGFDIEYEILEIENPKEYVDIAAIKVDSSYNKLVYGEEESLIVNVSAKSLQALYEQYGYRGLFAQNLRYYVKNARIDDSILQSIQETPDIFWYLNNGIIIICDRYSIYGDKVVLYNFSIINGGQTTKLIGEAIFEKDFFLQCKIVKNKYSDENEKIAFIAHVAEASNTQKPIKEKDLIANKPEQRLLKKQLAEAGIYCQIKRGEKVNKKLYPAAWQNTTNEELGQFILSFAYQKPGIARGNKASICGNKERYNLLFGKKYDSAFLADLLKLKAYYKLWMNDQKKNDDGSDEYKLGLVNNGMFFTIAILGIVCKLYYHPEYIAAINEAVISDQKIEIVSQHDIDHKFLSSDMDKKDFFNLFELCYSEFYRPGYEFLKMFKGKYNNYSNFTKVDNNYKTYVFKQICLAYASGLPKSISDKLDKYLYHATQDDLMRDNQLLQKYTNIITADTGIDSDVPEVIVASIKEALTDYRTKTYKKNHIKPYEVFNNASRDRIAKYAPTNIDDLRDLRCLDEGQLQLYGDDIVAIVNQFLNE